MSDFKINPSDFYLYEESFMQLRPEQLALQAVVGAISFNDRPAQVAVLIANYAHAVGITFEASYHRVIALADRSKRLTKAAVAEMRNANDLEGPVVRVYKEWTLEHLGFTAEVSDANLQGAFQRWGRSTGS